MIANLYIYSLDNKKEIAKIVDYDAYSDIALLEIEDNLGLKEAKIGIEDVNELQNEIYSLNIGDTVVLEYYRGNVVNTVELFLNK